jgi:hypothetical protein
MSNRQFLLKGYKEYKVLKIMSPGKTKSINIAQGQASVALESYLKSDTELQGAVSCFVQSLYDLYAENLPSESQLANALDTLWMALLDIAQSTAYSDLTQDRLVAFVKAVKSLPPPSQPAPQVWGLSLWSDLPILGATIRERWNTGPSNQFLSPPSTEMLIA